MHVHRSSVDTMLTWAYGGAMCAVHAIWKLLAMSDCPDFFCPGHLVHDHSELMPDGSGRKNIARCQTCGEEDCQTVLFAEADVMAQVFGSPFGSAM